MLNIQFIKDNKDAIKQNILNRRFDPKKADIDRLLELDKQRVDMQTKVDNARAERNKFSHELQKNHDSKLIEQARGLKTQIGQLEDDLNKIQTEWKSIMDWIPNLKLDEVPIGRNETENVEIKAWSPKLGYVSEVGKADQKMDLFGSMSDGDFKPIPHWELGKKLDILDLEVGAKVSGSRFYYLKGAGALMMYGIFDILTKKLLSEGFTPMEVPILVKGPALYGSSQFPADEDQIYKIETKYVEDDNQLYLVGSSEPPLFAYFSDRIIPEKNLPVKVFANTPCFRSEAGSWGKDIRGMKRVHQFKKLEMDMVIKPDLDEARKMHEYLLGINEWLLQTLKIPYHVINMCTGDLGYAAAAKKYDIEVWLASEGKWMETMSDSITTDFQTRRFNIKSQGDDGQKTFAYTLNDTGATDRLLIAIMEHYQQLDGSLKVPEVLKEYVGAEVINQG